MPGRFIVLEGPDGAGTTSHTRLLADLLRARGERVMETAEPTAGPIGTFVRSHLKSGSSLSPTALQHLFTADRAWHIEAEISPALAAGTTVISDRYTPSTIVYGDALDIRKELLENMNTYFIQPTHLFLLLPPYEVCRERLLRRAVRDRLEDDTLQRRVYDGYVRYAKEHPDVIVIDSSGAKEGVTREIARALNVTPL